MVPWFSAIKDYVLQSATTVQDDAIEAVSNGLENLICKKYEFKGRYGEVSVKDVGILHETKAGSISVSRCVKTKEVYALKRTICGGKEGHVTYEQLQDAESEQQLLDQLPPHPNIVRCYGTSIENVRDGHIKLLLLEFCDGGTLAEFLSNKAPGDVPDDECVEVVLHMSRALDHLHNLKMPTEHLGITPDHILWSGTSGQWKLCDFGSCVIKVVQEEEEAPDEEIREIISKCILEPADRPPEYSADGKVPLFPLAIDIWMLGITLFQTMFVRKPFKKLDGETLRYPLEVPGWAAMTPRGGKLCILLHWMLAQQPRSRPTAGQLSEVLEKWRRIKPLNLASACSPEVRESIKETLRGVERRIMLNECMKLNSDDSVSIRDDFLQVLQILQAVPLSQLKEVCPRGLAQKISRLRWSYGQPGFQGVKPAESNSTTGAGQGGLFAEIDDVLEDLEDEVENLNVLDDLESDAIGGKDKQSQGKKDLIDLTSNQGEEWVATWQAEMKSCDQPGVSEWQAFTEDDRAEKLQVLNLFFTKQAAEAAARALPPEPKAKNQEEVLCNPFDENAYKLMSME